MTDFASLDPETRAVALVGAFLQRWAIMEHAMRGAIEKAFGLDILQAAILGVNVSLRDKINILKTLVSNSIFHPDSERARFTKVLDAIATASAKRNMMAHDLFHASEDKQGVTFYVVKAKGKLEFPDTIWPTPRFQVEYTVIDEFTKVMNELSERLSYSESIKALFSGKSPLPNAEPIGGLFGLDPVNFLSPPSQGLLGYNLLVANPGTAPQTPPTPKE